jgi:hypothetical protein
MCKRISPFFSSIANKEFPLCIYRIENKRPVVIDREEME